MPIIEYFHLTQTYRVSIARTVEWAMASSYRYRHLTNENTPYAPFVGYNEDTTPDAQVILETTDKTLAFQKMTELWNDWSSKDFTGVVHA